MKIAKIHHTTCINQKSQFSKLLTATSNKNPSKLLILKQKSIDKVFHCNEASQIPSRKLNPFIKLQSHPDLNESIAVSTRFPMLTVKLSPKSDNKKKVK